MKEAKNLHTPSMRKARKRTSRHTPVIDFARHAVLKDIGKGRLYHLDTYGCQANEADSETIRGLLGKLGFRETDEESRADLILLNTCVVRSSAASRIFGELGRLKRYKRENPDLILGVAGCLPQDESATKRILEEHPHVDLIFGTHNIHRLPELLETALLSKEKVVEVLSEEGDIVENLPKRRFHTKKAYVNIMYGCDEFCTYCVVPYTRGKERSRPFARILAEIDALIAEGYREVTLLGQNVNAYGKDLEDEKTFADLLRALHERKIARVRFTTSHPRDFDQQTIDVLARGGNLMPHIHLPVQAGGDKILGRMNRKYTRDDILDLVGRMRKAIPGVALTTDLIVGFPGETEADFEKTLDLVEKVGFEGAFTFMFSPREGTPAAKFTDNVPQETKKERLHRLQKRVDEGYKKGNERFLEKTVDVLVEKESKEKGMLAGYSPHHKLVHFAGSTDLVGEIVPVRITEAKTWFLRGEIHEESP